MFDGVPTSRKTVSLAGRKDKKDTKSILDKARLQREARAKERLRIDSAVRLQRVVRGTMTRRNLWSKMRADTDKKCSDIENIRTVFAQMKNSSQYRVPFETIRGLIVSLKMFYGRHAKQTGKDEVAADVSRLAVVLKLLSYTVLEGSSASSVMNLSSARCLLLEALFLMRTQRTTGGNERISASQASELAMAITQVLDSVGEQPDRLLFAEVCKHCRALLAASLRTISTAESVGRDQGDLLLGALCRYVGKQFVGSRRDSEDADFLVPLVEEILCEPGLASSIMSPTIPASVKDALGCLHNVFRCEKRLRSVFEACSVLGASNRVPAIRLLSALCNSVVLAANSGSAAETGEQCNLQLSQWLSPRSGKLYGDAGLAELFWITLWRILRRSEGAIPMLRILGEESPAFLQSEAAALAKFEDVPPSECLKALEVYADVRRACAQHCAPMDFDVTLESAVRDVLRHVIASTRFVGEVVRAAVNSPTGLEENSVGSYQLAVYSLVISMLPSSSSLRRKLLNSLRVGLRRVADDSTKCPQGLDTSLSYCLYKTLFSEWSSSTESRTRCIELVSALSMKTNESVNSERVAVKNDLCGLFLELFSFELLLVDDEDVFVPHEQRFDTETGVMSAEASMKTAEIIRDTLYSWLWSVDAVSCISFVQSLLIGLVDKPTLGATRDTYTCSGQLMQSYVSMAEIVGSHDTAKTVDVDLPPTSTYCKVLTVIRIYNQIYDRHCRYFQPKLSSMDNESKWLWSITCNSMGGGLVVSPVLPPPMNLVPGSLSNTTEATPVGDLQLLHTNDLIPNGEESDLVAYGLGYGPLFGSTKENQDAKSNLKVTFAAAALMKAILISIPQVIPFQRRVSVFQFLLNLDKSRIANGNSEQRFLDLIQNSMGFHHFGGPPLNLAIRRTAVLEDAFTGLHRNLTNRARVKNAVHVEFMAEQGHIERGIDGGGLFKEFVDLFLKTAFAPETKLFVPTAEEWLTPNTSTEFAKIFNHDSNFSVSESDLCLEYFELVGRVLGKAVYERMLVQSQLSVNVLNALLGKTNRFDDLRYFDVQLLRSLKNLKHLATNPGRAAATDDLGLSFVMSTSTGDVELVPGGVEIAVNRENIFSYIYEVANFKLNKESYRQTMALVRGFREVIQRHWVAMFSAMEMQMLIGGESRPLDLADLQRHCTYAGGYHSSQPYIQGFWSIVGELNIEDQGNLLKFVTSCARQPLLGFQQLSPPFCIQKIPTHESDSVDEGRRRHASAQGLPLTSYVEPARLPSAGTCMNLLKLPEYLSLAMLREKLLYAIRSQSGFELT